MPQLWVSYEELGSHYGCHPSLIRERVALSGWPRRKCSDGVTRVKLPLPVMDDYLRKSWMASSSDIQTIATSWPVLAVQNPTAVWSERN